MRPIKYMIYYISGIQIHVKNLYFIKNIPVAFLQAPTKWRWYWIWSLLPIDQYKIYILKQIAWGTTCLTDFNRGSGLELQEPAFDLIELFYRMYYASCLLEQGRWFSCWKISISDVAPKQGIFNFKLLHSFLDVITRLLLW